MFNLFRKDKPEKNDVRQDYGSTQQHQQASSSTHDRGARHISNLESYIESLDANDPIFGDCLMEAGWAYMRGEQHAPEDALVYAPLNKAKALQYFERANAIGSVDALYALGYYYVYEKNDDLSFVTGVTHLKNAHLRGHKTATDLLNHMIERGAFTSNILCIEDIVNI